MTRPRRQIMAKGNDAIANSKGKSNIIKETEKSLKSGRLRTTKLVKKTTTTNSRKEKSRLTMAEKETPMELDDDDEEDEENNGKEEKNTVRNKRNNPRKMQFNARNSTSEIKADNVNKNSPVPIKKAVAKTKVGNRKRSHPESSSVSGDAKRLKVIDPVPRHRRGMGYVLTLGQGDVGQLGLGIDITERKKPSLVNLPSKIVDICAGGMHTVCLSEDGKVYTFGCNDEGALGRDTSEEGSECEPGEVELEERVIQISAGDSHSAALTHNGCVYAWGTFRDSSGAMGLLKSQSVEKTPHIILAGIPVAKIASGSDHLALLTTQGNLYTSGCAEQGQLGRVAECFSSRGGRKGLGLLLNPGLAVVRRKKGKQVLFDDVWTGSYSTFVRIRDSTDVYVCGLNNYFQLGSEDIKNHFVLERSDSFSSKQWIQIAGGQHHTLALDDNGDVYAMGRKEYGRLGLGEDTQDVAIPTPVPELINKKCIDIACGVATSYAVDSIGQAYSWGMGTNFALGTGEEEDILEPIKITGKQLEGRKNIAISAGGQHAVLLVVPEPEPSSGE